MFVIKLIFFILVLQICKQVSCRECSDCMEYTSCKASADHAVYKQDDITIKLFNEVLCGIVGIARESIPKVCCSDFPPLTMTVDARFSSIGQENTGKENLLPEQCGYIYGDRIIGGTTPKLYEFPWMALISYRRNDGLRFMCEGSIINSRYILTAAHCVIGMDIAGVRVGEYNIDTEEDCEVGLNKVICEDHIQDIYVEETISHENYQTTPITNDIALIRLLDPIDFNFTNVAPICLPTSAELRNKDLTNRYGTVAGWGVTETGTESSILLKVDVPVKSMSQCRSYYDRIENQFCAGALKKDSCSGDSGGPLILQEDYNNVNRYVQYGIVSHGPTDCGSESPGAYTDVRMFVDWILQNIKE